VGSTCDVAGAYHLPPIGLVILRPEAGKSTAFFAVIFDIRMGAAGGRWPHRIRTAFDILLLSKQPLKHC
jgi:hypothetical protein